MMWPNYKQEMNLISKRKYFQVKLQNISDKYVFILDTISILSLNIIWSDLIG